VLHSPVIQVEEESEGQKVDQLPIAMERDMETEQLLLTTFMSVERGLERRIIIAIIILVNRHTMYMPEIVSMHRAGVSQDKNQDIIDSTSFARKIRVTSSYKDSSMVLTVPVSSKITSKNTFRRNMQTPS
jgi:hypothetical protein